MHRYNSILIIFDPQLLYSILSGRILHYTDDTKKTVIMCQSRPTSRGDFGTPIFCVLVVSETFLDLIYQNFFKVKIVTQVFLEELEAYLTIVKKYSLSNLKSVQSHPSLRYAKILP